MDELKLKLKPSTKFMKGIFSKLIARVLDEKLKCHVDIQLNDIELTASDGQIHIHANVDGSTTTGEFMKLIKLAGLD